MSSVQQWLERVGLSEVEGLVAAFLAVADDISDVRMMNADDVATAVISLNLKKMTMARVQKEVAALHDEGLITTEEFATKRAAVLETL